MTPNVVSGSAVLRARLRPPALPTHFVPRRRLDDLLNELVASPLTTVVAPAGSGKSLLLSSWLAQAALPGAWLTLDESDRDGVQCWGDLITAIETLPAGPCAEARRLLRGPCRLNEVAVEVLNDLDAAPAGESCVLVVDDAHIVDGDEALARSLGLFLQHLPGWLHVVLSSRRELALPVDRLRARGQLRDVHFAELRFSQDEASELLALLAPSLSEPERDATVARIDGWAAGLQLAGLAARSTVAQARRDAPSRAAERLVDDFVWHEVLAAESSELVDALLDISIVDRVNEALAVAITGRPDAGDLLHTAEARGLFVSRLESDGWFEVHALVRSSLRSELTLRSQSRCDDRHARAAQWFEDDGEIPAAIEHWLTAKRPQNALRLLAACNAELYDAGREPLIVRTIAQIPAGTRAADLASMIDYAWCQLLVDRRGFIDAVEQASWWHARHSNDPAVQPRLMMLAAMSRLADGDWIEAGATACRAMLAMGDGWWADPQGRFGWNVVAREAAYSERWDETAEEIRDATLALSRDPERRAALEGTRAIGHALAGRPVEALRVSAGVRDLTDVANMSVLRVELDLAEAIAHRELGDGVRAVGELQALADAPTETMLFCRVLALCELAEAHLDSGRPDAAKTELARAAALVDDHSLGRPVRDRVARSGTLVALAALDVDDAARWATTIEDEFWGDVSRARVSLARGDRDEALAMVDDATPRCPRHEVVHALVRAGAGLDRDEATECATTAVQLATETGILQTIASEGPGTLEIVERAAWRVPEDWMDRLRRLVAAGAAMPVAGGPDQVEPLTARERDILRYLPSRLTVSEIADECFVSVNTLKFHLKVIYRKLGVASRAEAAAKARELSSM